MEIMRRLLGSDKQGKPYYLSEISNKAGTLKVNILTLGATIHSLYVPDRNGVSEDIVLGQDNLEEYMENPSCSGSVIGRFANRIGGASFVLNQKRYTLDKNDRGNSIHGGRGCYAGKNFEIVSQTTEGITLHLLDEGEGGFPGQVDFWVHYRVTDENELSLTYKAIATQDTPVNFTNHCYFNLGGHKSNTALEHEIMIDSDFYTVLDENCLPNGEILKTTNTPLDFTKPVKLKTRLEELRNSGLWQNGFDHNYVLKGDLSKPAASAYDPSSGRIMQVFTDQPGMQFYTANHLDGNRPCKDGIAYRKHCAYCFETQNFPDSVNVSHFPNCVIEQGQSWESKTIFKFSFM